MNIKINYINDINIKLMTMTRRVDTVSLLPTPRQLVSETYIHDTAWDSRTDFAGSRPTDVPREHTPVDCSKKADSSSSSRKVLWHVAQIAIKEWQLSKIWHELNRER